MISCSKQMAHFAQNGIFLGGRFFSCPEWLGAVSRRITKPTQAEVSYMTIHSDLLFDCIDLKRLQASRSISAASKTPLNASGLFTVNIADLYWPRCTISW